MKIKQIITLLAGITFVALSPVTWAAGHGGGGGGGFHGGDGFHGGRFHGGGFHGGIGDMPISITVASLSLSTASGAD
jgi:hypothetical protein